MCWPTLISYKMNTLYVCINIKSNYIINALGFLNRMIVEQ